ncbi:MAG: MarR family transcriptional regulator [Naasia sp.]|jgi:DNA-binding MarR family transcriptional regulator|uniref:MarR family winged helix-turn-helix transcriptional regulator n=1 Tax=Naasia sp. TaxID=2546198 RepID=UPI00261A3259|nr:MarR family transcriptional regulator [Naasia sp.]MCU1569456.1 MarR family transcriptional regulator [Naasia sp.]
MSGSDEVDRIVEGWERARPELDFTPLQVLSRVRRLARQLEPARKAAFSTAGLDSWEFDVLSGLRRSGPPYQLTPKSLLQITLVSSGTMSNRIDRLVSRALVERRIDPTDGRGVLVVLTDEGRRRVDAAIGALLVAEAELLDGLSRSDQERVAALLRKLSHSFDSA